MGYSCQDEIQDIELLKSLLQDLEHIRMDRIKIGLQDLAVKSKQDALIAVKVCGCYEYNLLVLCLCYS